MTLYDWTELKDKSNKLGLGDWSYHKVKLANSCPLLFQETYLRPHVPTTHTDKNKQFKGVSTKVGIMLHSLFETCLLAPALPVEITWLPMVKAHKLLAEEQKLANRLQPSVTKLVQRLRAAIAKYKLHIHIELKLKPTGMLGYADFVGITEDGKSALLLDYKSYNETEERAESVARQLSFYTLCLMLDFPGITSVKGGCVYIPEESIKYQPVVYRDRLDLLEKYWFERLSTTINMIADLKAMRPKGEDFPYFKGEACLWCTKLDCPTKKKKRVSKKEKTMQLGA